MKYYLYLDECGDHNLANFDPSFPIFTLCGILISENDNRALNAEIVEIKRKYWGDKKVILHSREIRKFEKGFEILFDPEVKKVFYEDIDAVMSTTDYTIVACSIMKEKYIRKYGRLNDDVYGLSLSFIMERAVYYLDSMNDPDAELQVIVERRGKREDASLLSYYNEVFDRGTYFVNTGRLKKYFNGFEFRDKKDDIIGLQIADLAAYPVTRYVLDSDAYNRAFEVVEGKIVMYLDKFQVEEMFRKVMARFDRAHAGAVLSEETGTLLHHPGTIYGIKHQRWQSSSKPKEEAGSSTK